MPPIHGRKVTITDDEVAEQQPVDRSRLLGNGPAHNQAVQAARRTDHYEAERAIAIVQMINDPEELNRVGMAAARRLRRMGAIKPKKKRRLTDRALLRLYLEITPVLLSFAIVTPLVIWGGLRLVASAWFSQQFVELSGVLIKACPPNCEWQHLAMWAVWGGVSLLLAVLVSYGLRKRLLRASH
ncbi:MAG: hypothetical protein KC415_21640 [Anaerolineales bacterium]|nr:hypothetical protein [Anaerolineales bacterium]MCB8991813.1 hypothetical protein [Ardenticatenaceae bacterium]